MNTRALIFAIVSILIFVMLLAIATSVTITESSYSSGPFIKVSVVNQEPDPASPGSYVDLRLKVENWGAGAASNVAVELTTYYPLSLVDSPVKEVGSFAGVQKGPEGVIVRYRFLVDNAAPSGNARAGLRYRIGSEWTSLEDVNITVRSYDTALQAELSTVPSPLAQGENGRILVRLRNPASSLLKNINVKLNLGSSFVPVNSTDSAAIPRLNPESSADAFFTIVARPDAKSGYYALPISLSYTDVWGKNYSSNITGGVIISSLPKVYAAFDEAKAKNGAVTVTVRVVNNGFSDVKLLRATLLESADYDIISGDDYIGELDSDDFTSIDFELLPKKERFDMPLRLSFTDALNREYSRDFSVKVLAPPQNQSPFSLTGVILTIAIIAVGVLAYRRRRK